MLNYQRVLLVLHGATTKLIIIATFGSMFLPHLPLDLNRPRPDFHAAPLRGCVAKECGTITLITLKTTKRILVLWLHKDVTSESISTFPGISIVRNLCDLSFSGQISHVLTCCLVNIMHIWLVVYLPL